MSIHQRVAAAIGNFTAAVAKLAAPAMPWLFIALRRAFIPTMVWLIVAVFFFAVPQSREVLHGLSEPLLKSFTDFDPQRLDSPNVWALSAYVATAVLLSFAVWYCARLLSTVGADRATPMALQSGPGFAGLRQATIWYPRALGVSVLAAAVGALIYANYTPQLSETSAFFLATLSLVGPLMLATGYLVITKYAAARKLGLLMLGTGALAVATAAVLLVTQQPKWPMWAWSIASSLLPGLLLILLVRRRSVMKRLNRWGVHGAAEARRFGDAILTVVVLVVLSSLVLLLLARLPPVVMRTHGSAATILLFLMAASLLLTGIQLVLRRVASDVPGLTIAVAAFVTLLVAFVGEEDLGTETLELKPAALANEAATQAKLAALPMSTNVPAAPRNLFVNAHGGGLRAAVFTAQVLARADDATCGKFGEQVAAFSGVSGGSVGIATYLIARQELIARDAWKDCREGSPGPLRNAPLTDVVTSALVQDHLSGLISRMLAVDAPHFWGSPLRGQALLDSWNSSLASALAAQLKEADAGRYAALAMPLADLNGGMPQRPSVYFNATDADSGHITWFSNDHGGSAGTYRQPARAVSVSVGQAVLHSARFPIVAPAGEFRFPWAPDKKARLVDGGYADDSGASTLLDVMQSMNPDLDKARLINIDGNPSGESACTKRAGPSHIPTAVRGLLRARAARAERSVELFESSTRTPPISARLNLEDALAEPGDQEGDICQKVERAEKAPLGWYMSFGAASKLARSAELEVRKMCRSLTMQCRPATMPPLALE